MDEFGNVFKPWSLKSTTGLPATPAYTTGLPATPAYGSQASPMNPGNMQDPFNFAGRTPVPSPMQNLRNPYSTRLPEFSGLGVGSTPSFKTAPYTAPDNTDPGATVPEADPFKLSPLQAGVGAAPGIIGGLYGGFSNMAKRDNLQREDLTPDAVRSGAEDAFRREKSALVPNYGEAVDRITRGAGDVVKTAERAGGSAGDVINAAVAANNMAGNQLFDLEQAGANNQSRNRARGDQYRSTLGEYQRMSDDRFKQQYAAYDNASKDSFMSAFNTAAGFGMMAL